ncbi:MAG: methylaspartate mutase accessory protein GlmL [Candidatus Binatia bacterium]
MKSLAILIDFGSTYTKVTAVELAKSQVIGRSQAPSTVLTDVRDGLLRALLSLHERFHLFLRPPTDLEILLDQVVLASSSAAGGLRMAVIGLVPGLTVQAATQAALGAGAKVVGSTGFKLEDKAMQEIASLRPDMVLLTGGTDGGDSATILHNACLLARSSLRIPVVVAGNSAVAGKVCRILTDAGKEARRAENVMPRPGELAVESAREEIRRLFIERITQAKGLDKIREIVPVVLPTPMAVLQGVLLGAQGHDDVQGWGDMLVVDVGGATTDVHSIGFGHPSGENTIVQGLSEPFAKRTVEGDLGIRYNAGTLLSRAGADYLKKSLSRSFPEHAVSSEDILDYIAEISRETDRVPQKAWHSAVDALLSRVAVDIAVERHVGKRERILMREGEAWVHYGKDLRETGKLVGTGGVFIHNPYASLILHKGGDGNARFDILRPKNPEIFIDSSYLLYAVGLLAESHPAVAARIFNQHMRPLSLHVGD